MKKFIHLMAACLLAAPAFAADPSTPSVFQIRLVMDSPSGNSEEMTLKDPVRKETLHVEKKVLLDQTGLKSAKVTKDNLGHPQIDIVLTDGGRKQFAEITRQNINKRLAIIIDGQLYTAPTIRSEIPGGKAQISGSFTEQEAKDLAKKIIEKVKK